MRPLPVVSWRAGAAFGVALIALVNAVTLGLVAYNRSGEPDAVLALSGRELEVPWQGRVQRAENSGLDLALRWRVAPAQRAATGDAGDSGKDDDGSGAWPYARQATWLDAAKLSALGFTPADEPEARRGRSRPVLLVLELDGPAYGLALDLARRKMLRETALRDANPGKTEFAGRARRAIEALAEHEREASRLFVVDAGLDAAALRAAYPDRARYAIVGGRVRPGWPDSKRPRDRFGWVEAVEVAAVHVPRALRPLVPAGEHDGSAGAAARNAGFVARIAFGRRLEPWIVSIEAAKPVP